MMRALLSVGGFTMLSRITGFAREIFMAAIVGAGPLMDAFVVAFRLPNHFRAIFAEGAFNSAFVPLYTKIRTQSGDSAASTFADDILSWQVVAQAGLLLVALMAMPWIVAGLAPGFVDDPQQLALCIALTRITFGYLLCITLVTHLGAMLNARGYFKAAAAAPVLLNVFMIAGVLAAAWFPTAAHGVAWGVLAGGVAEALLMVAAAWRAGIRFRVRWPALPQEARAFFGNFGPAVVGSAGVQLALFADTMLVSFLAAGEPSSLYFADRINQLPLGVIGVALGTVLLPEMSRLLAAGDIDGSARAQARAAEIGLLLTLPCMALFVLIPHEIMLGLFSRGAFDQQAAASAATVLQAYALGMPAFILIRCVTPMFHARGDTVTPARATLTSIGFNMAVKVGLIFGLGWGAEGLALGTSVGAWISLALLLVFAGRAGLLALPPSFGQRVSGIAAATAFMIAVLVLVGPLLLAVAHGLGQFGNEVALMALGLVAGGAYGLAAFGQGLHRRL